MLSVLVGVFVASWLLGRDLGPLAIAVVAGGSLVAASATRSSRWYITPAFSTFLVFWVLLYGDATKENISHRFDQRVLETVSGVMIAYVFGLVIPKLRPAE